MGPLPESQEHKYTFFNCDQFSKLYEAVALLNQKAKSCQERLLNTR